MISLGSSPAGKAYPLERLLRTVKGTSRGFDRNVPLRGPGVTHPPDLPVSKPVHFPPARPVPKKPLIDRSGGKRKKYLSA